MAEILGPLWVVVDRQPANMECEALRTAWYIAGAVTLVVTVGVEAARAQVDPNTEGASRRARRFDHEPVIESDSRSPQPPGGVDLGSERQGEQIRDDPLLRLCEGQSRVEITLSSDEFDFKAYDYKAGLIAIDAPSELAPKPGRSRPVRLRFVSNQRPLIRVAPDAILGLHQAWQEQRLQLAVEVQMVQPPYQGEAEQPQRCGDETVELRPVSMSLREGSATVAEAELPRSREELDALRKSRSMARLGPFNLVADSPPVEQAVVKGALLDLTRNCHNLVLQTVPLLQGATVVELAMSPVGRPRRPIFPIDAVVYPPFTQCLRRAIQQSDALWQAIPSGARLTVPIYLRAVPAEASPAPARGTNAPLNLRVSDD